MRLLHVSLCRRFIPTCLFGTTTLAFFACQQASKPWQTSLLALRCGCDTVCTSMSCDKQKVIYSQHRTSKQQSRDTVQHRTTTKQRSLSPSSPHFLSPSHCDAATHHKEEEKCTTMNQNQSTCHGGEGRWCGGCGEREQQKRREEEAQHLTHSHMYHLLLVCACVACRWRRT